MRTGLPFIAGYQGKRFAFQFCLAHQQSWRNRNAHPTVFQYIHGEMGSAGRQIT